MTSLLFLLAFLLGLHLWRLDTLWLIIILTVSLLLLVFWRYRRKERLLVVTALLGGFLIAAPIFKEDQSIIHEGIVIETKENYFLFQSGPYRYYVKDKASERETFDILQIKGRSVPFLFPHHEAQFDFAKHLRNKGVTRELLVEKITVRMNMPLRINARKSKFLKAFPPKTKALLDAFLFNHKDYADTTLSNADALDLVHLLSLSGIYLYAVLGVLKKLFALAMAPPKAELLALFLLSPYLLCALNKIGVVRIILLLLIRNFDRHFFKHHHQRAEHLSWSALILLFIDHHLAYQAAFQLGLFISIMLLFLSYAFRKRGRLYRRLIIMTAIILFTIPFSSLTGGSFHLFGLLYQLLLLPLGSLFIFLGILSFYTVPFVKLLSTFAKLFDDCFSFFLRIDIALPFLRLTPFFILIYYVLFFYGLYLLESGRLHHLHVTTAVLLLGLTFSFVPLRPMLTRAIYFIDVGQGDAILIHDKTKNVLIDTGGDRHFDMAQKTLIPFFQKEGIRRLDLLITTHDDFDHCGAASSLLENFPVKEYRHERNEFPCQVGDLTFDNLNDYVTEEENDRSLVFNLTFMERKWLLTGDASLAVEEHLIKKGIDLDCDVLKVGHHGSKYSTSETFLEKTTPEIAIISCGVKNSYGHPAPIIIDRLQRHGVIIHRTDIEGTISFVRLF